MMKQILKKHPIFWKGRKTGNTWKALPRQSLVSRRIMQSIAARVWGSGG